jgi:hypothetical protein
VRRSVGEKSKALKIEVRELLTFQYPSQRGAPTLYNWPSNPGKAHEQIGRRLIAGLAQFGYRLAVHRKFERDGSPLRLAHKKKNLPPSSEEDIAVSNNSLLERVAAVAEQFSSHA